MDVIPGPKKPTDMDSYLLLLIQELLQLEIGVKAFDALTKSPFLLHAFLIVIFGDISAISMIMCVKGHNTKLPCHMCKIVAVQNDLSKMLYVPLNHTNFPSSVTPCSYDTSPLPLHTHKEFMWHAEKVQTALTATASNQLTTKQS